MKNKIVTIILFAIIIIESLLLVYFYQINASQSKFYKNELNLFANSKEFDTNGEIFFIGNSIVKSGKWDSLLQQTSIINKGISGVTTMDAVMMVDKFMPARADKVFIMLGVNDIKVGAPWNVALKNYVDFLYSIKLYSPRTDINIISVLPTNSVDFKNYSISNEEIKALNSALGDMCYKYQWNFIDCYDDFLDENKNLSKNYSDDGLHLTEQGYRNITSFIKPHL